MIINIRGASGSGKSTIVRKVVAEFGHRQLLEIPGRKRPIGYVLSSPRRPTKDLYIPGHYETECGGCDTIADDAMNTIYRLVREGHASGANVLFEGLLISAEARRMIEMHNEGLPLLVIRLTTDIDTCLQGVEARRARRDPTLGLGPNTRKNLESKDKGAKLCLKRFLEAGVPCAELDREAALQRVLKELGL